MMVHIWYPKGGTGKTTVATSLAVALSRSWGRALYVELGPVPLGVRLLGVPPDGKMHRGRAGVLAVYTTDVEKARQVLSVASQKAVAAVVDYPPCIKPEGGGLLVPVADWLSAEALAEAAEGAKVVVLNKDRGWEGRRAPYEFVRLPFSYAVERAVAEGVPPVLVRPLSAEHKQFVEGVKRLADRLIELAGVGR